MENSSRQEDLRRKSSGGDENNSENSTTGSSTLYQMRHFPNIPAALGPIGPLVKEADILMETLISLSDERRYEAQMVAYCCLSYAIWLGQSCSVPNSEECIEYLNILQVWQERLRPDISNGEYSGLDEAASANVCEFLGSVICQQQDDDHKLNYKKPPLERCIVSTGPATASVIIFENERLAPFGLGWSAAHLLPYSERSNFSDETGYVHVPVPQKELHNLALPLEDYSWASDWYIDKDYTQTDATGWSYGLTWWMLSLRLRQNASVGDPSMAFVRRRKWVRHLNGQAGNLPAATDHYAKQQIPVNAAARPSSMKSNANTGGASSSSQYFSSNNIALRAVCAQSRGVCADFTCADTNAYQDNDVAWSSQQQHQAQNFHGMMGATTMPPVLTYKETIAVRESVATQARRALSLAEAMLKEQPLQMRAWFHAAAVYLEIVGELGDPDKSNEGGFTGHTSAQGDDDYLLNPVRVRALARTASHLRENCVFEYSDFVESRYDLPHDVVLGRGSYGEVRLAQHKKTKVQFACKFVSLNNTNENAIVEKLHAEISAMRILDHPNILKLHEVYYSPRRTACLVMELCTGGELFELVNNLKSRKPHGGEQSANLSPEHCQDFFDPRVFMRQMCSAICYIHENGIMHRDLKLENWLIESVASSSPGRIQRRGDCRLKLIDFGLARHFRIGEKVSGTVGSLFYIAPEVLTPHSLYDFRCDLWSLGVIAYMLVSGAPPFWGDSDAEIRHHILAGIWDFPKQFFYGVSASARDFISGLLQRDPAMRLTARQALGHTWLNSKAFSRTKSQQFSSFQTYNFQKEESNEVFIAVCNSLLNFIKLNKFQQLLLNVAAYELEASAIDQPRAIFELLDTDHSGTLNFTEFCQIFPASHTIDLRTLFDTMNFSHSNEIHLTEFLAATAWQFIAFEFDEARLERIFSLLTDDSTETIFSLDTLAGVDCHEVLLSQPLTYHDFLSSWRDAMHSLLVDSFADSATISSSPPRDSVSPVPTVSTTDTYHSISPPRPRTPPTPSRSGKRSAPPPTDPLPSSKFIHPSPPPSTLIPSSNTLISSSSS